jgi:hypothetical protein
MGLICGLVLRRLIFFVLGAARQRGAQRHDSQNTHFADLPRPASIQPQPTVESKGTLIEQGFSTDCRFPCFFRRSLKASTARAFSVVSCPTARTFSAQTVHFAILEEDHGSGGDVKTLIAPLETSSGTELYRRTRPELVRRFWITL